MLPSLNKGMKVNSCNWLDLYTTSGRVLPLRNILENRLESTNLSGEAKANERQVILTPDFPLNKMVVGDFLSIPWGIRPNNYVPPSLPNNAGPQVWLKTPTVPQLLTWDGTQYTGSTLTLSKDVNGDWCLTGEVTECIGASLVCLPYPTGYGFLKFTGPLADFKILRIDAEEDAEGLIAFYTVYTEYLDRNNEYIQ